MKSGVYLNIHDDDFEGFESSDDMVEDDMVDVDNLPDGMTCQIVRRRAHNPHHPSALLVKPAPRSLDSIDDLSIEFR